LGNYVIFFRVPDGTVRIQRPVGKISGSVLQFAPSSQLRGD
jgi:hypothetical protein